MDIAKRIRQELIKVADAEKARVLARFFKTGPGEYGEGDRFHGVVVPKIRRVAKAFRDVPEPVIVQLLDSPFHEERMTAVLIMVDQYRRGDEEQRRSVYDLYLASTARINNWDLVDLSSPNIVGAHIYHGKDDAAVLTRLALSGELWERRIAMLATFYGIYRGDAGEAMRIAEMLVDDPHDLIRKAVGWMLREVGKRCSMEILCTFLDKHAAVMPRTMLRYAIERFPDPLRRKYMKSLPRSSASSA